MTERYRLVVIGGGAMGVSLLYHLAKLGWRDIALLEKNELTAGSTWHAAGLCTHFAHSPTIMEMRAQSVRLYRDILPEETGTPVGFHPCGAMRITRSEERLREFRHVRGLAKFVGYELEMLTPDDINRLHPLADLSDGVIRGGIFEPKDGHVDPSQATQAMAAVARSNGAKIFRHRAIAAASKLRDGWLLETVSGQVGSKRAKSERVEAEQVVIAAGTWGWEVGQMFGLDPPMVPMLHQYLVTDTVAEVAKRRSDGAPELPIIRDPEESWYVRQERDGLILGPYEKNAQPWSIDGVPPEFGADLLPPDLDRVEPIIEAAMARIPAIAGAGVKSVVNGPITFTPDGNPLIGPAFGMDNLWLLTGSSMGVMEGGGAGRYLAEWIESGSPPMDPIAVDSRRFGAYVDRSHRVAKAIECFGLQFGVYHPFEERAAARPALTTPIHQRQWEDGAVFGAAYGWERPNWFAGVTGVRTTDSFVRNNAFEAVSRECDAVASRVALGDLSAFAKFEIAGPDTPRLLERLGANQPPRPGRISLCHALTPTGGVFSELSIARLGVDHAYLVAAAAAERRDADRLRTLALGLDLSLRIVTAERGVLALMGPYAATLLQELTDADLSAAAFPWLSARRITVAGVDVIALRVSYIGENGFELHAPMARIARLYDDLNRLGAAHDLGRFGAFAMNVLRLEKGYRAWGADLTTERTPTESGLGALVRAEGRDFIGREEMRRRDAAPNAWRSVLLEIGPSDIEPSEIDPFYSHAVFCEDRPIGIVTSGGYGRRCGKTLSLALLRDPALAGAPLWVDILGDQRRASVLSEPPYDPANHRLRA